VVFLDFRRINSQIQLRKSISDFCRNDLSNYKIAIYFNQVRMNEKKYRYFIIFFFHFYLLSENYNESYAITYLTYGLTTVYIIQKILKV
jgi:hypothetical protein